MSPSNNTISPNAEIKKSTERGRRVNGLPSTGGGFSCISSQPPSAGNNPNTIARRAFTIE